MSNPAANDSQEQAEATTPSVAESQSMKVEGNRGEVSAQTVARLMGLTTQSDLKLVEGKLDLLVSRLGTISVRLDKIANLVQQGPTGNDMERIDVQIGTLRSSMRELLGALKANGSVTSASNAEQMSKAEKELETLPEGFDQK